MIFTLDTLRASDCWHQVLNVGRLNGDRVMVPDEAAMKLPERCREAADVAIGGHLGAPIPPAKPVDVESILAVHCRACDWLGVKDDGTEVCEHVGCPVCQRRIPGGLKAALAIGRFHCSMGKF